jgi:hypothetical protein
MNRKVFSFIIKLSFTFWGKFYFGEKYQVRRTPEGISVKMQRSSVSRALDLCMAGPSSNLGSASQGGPLLSREQRGNKSWPQRIY